MDRDKTSLTNPKTLFNPVLFWDADEIDMERHADYVIARVLNYGDEKDLKALRRYYPDERLIAVIKKARAIMPITARFWAVYFHIHAEEIACLKRFCQKKQ
ncbi:MAG: hypothetical protein HY266_08650 [Deltaproteobacteria bacterium]|nr:hypothetical protein [Deltaproteobacteria bacterium]